MSEYEDEQALLDSLQNVAYAFNARKAFNDFLNAIKSDKGLEEECEKIYSYIDDIILDKEKCQFEKTLEKGTIFYRARIISPDDDDKISRGIHRTSTGQYKGYNAVNSREPMIGVSGNGRNNIAGASYLYVASNPATACMEVKSQFGSLISLATFELNDDIKVIDFSTEKSFERQETELYNMSMGIFFTQLMMQFCMPINNERGYKATQLISDYLRKTGIDGIAYKSYFSPSGINYTIFNCHPSIIDFIDSRILIHKQANHAFWDVNNTVIIESNPNNELMMYDEKIANAHKEQLDKDFQVLD